MNLIKLLAVAVVIFGLSAAGSWYLQHSLEQEETGKGHDSPGPTAKSAPAAKAGGRGMHVEKVSLAPASRTPPSPEAEQVAQLAAGLQKQAESLRVREAQVAQRQKNLELVVADIRNEQKKIDELRKQLSEELKAVGGKMEAVERRASETRAQGEKLTEQAKDLKRSLLDVSEAEKRRVKQMATMYDAMDAEAAAQTFQQMVDVGKLDMAVKILAHMRERQAARVLAQLPDNAVAVQLLDRRKGLKAATARE
jgi:flagellar motility protein MotE (MotC chaperone)